MTTIVSVTPLAIEADSRTYKEAASFARLGYRSIVVEGRRSAMDSATLPFELVSVERRVASPGPEMDPRPGASGLRWLGEGLPDRLREPIRKLYRTIAWFPATARESRRTLAILPPAALYVLHEFTQFPAVYRAARHQRVPFVYDAHDLYSALAAEHRSQPGYVGSVAALRRVLERLCVRTAAEHITVAPGLALLQEERFHRHFTVIRNAHDPRLDEQPPTSIRKLAGVPEGAFLIVTIGNAKPSMAIRELIEAVALLPERVRLACVGRGYERYRGDILRLGLGDRISFVGAVPPAQVTSFVGDADLAANVYVPASINALNALPNGFFQSVAAGLPILYPRLPEIEALARQYRLGVPVEPRDPADVAAQVDKLLQGEALARFRTNAELAATELTWEREERELAAVIERALPPVTGGSRS